MKAFAVLSLLAIAAARPLDVTLVDSVNAANTTWKAGINGIFKGLTTDQIKGFLGADLTKPLRESRPGMITRDQVTASYSVPSSFDSRTAWPGCKSIGTIRDQGKCGSCWAVSATEAFTDRYCIVSGQKQNPRFSSYFMVTCDNMADGCDGGSTTAAWDFVEQSGLTLATCQPYNISTCPPTSEPCLPPFVQTPSCLGRACSGTGSFETFRDSNAYAPGCGYFSCSADAMAADIMKNGPIQTTMTVYEDFVHYKSGVYRHTTGRALGGHAIKIVGWGVENGTPYWNIANSWTTTWGDGGYFKILRGSNEVGIESDTGAGTPIVVPTH